MTRKGQKHNICGAIMKDGINICRLAPGFGTDHVGFGHCSHHGGSTRTGQRVAAVREAKSRAYEFGETATHIDPADALRNELARTNAMLEWAREMCVKVIEEHARASHRQTDIIESEKFMGYRSILNQERDRLVRIARSSLDSSLAQRRQVLAEAVAAVVIDCFHSMTRAIPDLTPEQLTAAQESIKIELAHASERLLLTDGQ